MNFVGALGGRGAGRAVILRSLSSGTLRFAISEIDS